MWSDDKKETCNISYALRQTITICVINMLQNKVSIEYFLLSMKVKPQITRNPMDEIFLENYRISKEFSTSSGNKGSYS